MTKPYVVQSGTPRIFWNIEANVGVASPNRPDDVQLIQLAYRCKSLDMDLAVTDLNVYARVVPGAPYSGREDDPLTLAIRHHQKTRGGVQDGHVSVIPPGTGMYDGKHTFMLIPLNNNMIDALPGDVFPRVDKHPRCQSLLRARITLICNGN
jgi:hypothetical protein